MARILLPRGVLLHWLITTAVLIAPCSVACDRRETGRATPQSPMAGQPPAASATQTAGSWPPVARSGQEQIQARHRMVDEQIATPRDGREPVHDKGVVQAMRSVPRHAFVPAAVREQAYIDAPLPIGNGQTISQP